MMSRTYTREELKPMIDYVKAFQRYQMEEVEVEDLILFVQKNYRDGVFLCDECKTEYQITE